MKDEAVAERRAILVPTTFKVTRLDKKDGTFASTSEVRRPVRSGGGRWPVLIAPLAALVVPLLMTPPPPLCAAWSLLSDSRYSDFELLRTVLGPCAPRPPLH